MYVSRRLRVFDDEEVLKPLVLRDEKPLLVSTAEELLREPDIAARRELAQRAAREEWTPSVARLASRIRALSNELADADVSAFSPAARAELRRLYQRLALLVAD
jgi:hypothetical protein